MEIEPLQVDLSSLALSKKTEGRQMFLFISQGELKTTIKGLTFVCDREKKDLM